MTISVLDFLAGLNWIDGEPLQVEPYRREIFRRALDERRADGAPRYNMVLSGRGKKNHKSTDLIIAGLFVLVCRESPQGSDALLVANDEDQAAQDLDLAKKLIAANPDLADELEVLSKEIRRLDGKGTMRVLPAGNVVGQHGKTAAFIGYDEIHGYRDHSLFEALAPDPTRYTLTWITSYDSIFDNEGCPLHDFKKIGMSGEDPGMLFSWYSADYCTDPDFADLPPDQRANPSMSSWTEPDYLERQRRRLPAAKFRRLHHNLPGAPQGAHFDQNAVDRAIVAGRRVLEPREGVDYLAFCDMSGGSSDDATLAIAHWTGDKAVLDLLVSQVGQPPFNPRLAVAGFAVICKRYHIGTVHGDAYAGQTFRHDFMDCRIDYVVAKQTRTDLYESLEVALNADQVELLDSTKLRRQLLTIVRRGASLDHMPGEHDDWATSAAGALTMVNPDIGAPIPHMLQHYRRLSEAAESVAGPPTLQQEHGHQPFMQFGSRRSQDAVRVAVPTEATHIGGISGQVYMVELDGTGRFCWMSAADAKAMLNSSDSGILAFRDANPELRVRLASAPERSQGIRLSDVLQAVEDARPRSPFDRGGAVHDTLRQLGRWTQ